MSDRLVVSAVGASIEIDMSAVEETSRARIRDAWRDALNGETESDVRVVARSGADEDAMLSTLSTEVTLAALDQRKGELWMLHAAGLADPRGHVVVLCAPSGTGKTTAARHLAAQYAYVSDETVGVDTRGGVTAYRKPLSIIEEGRASKTQVPPSNFEGASALPNGLRLSKIVILDRRDNGPDEALLEPVSLEEALVALTPQTSYLSDLPGALHMISSVLEATGGAVRVQYREARSLDGIVKQLMENAPSSIQPMPPGPATLPASQVQERADEHGAARHVRSEFVDALGLPDGKLAVLQREMTGGRLQILDGIAPTLWHAANGVSLSELSTQVVDTHGAPGDADPEELVSEALQALVADGVLRESTAE